MKVNTIQSNKLYCQNFNGSFKSPLDIERSYRVLKDTLWWRKEFPEKYGEDAALILNLIKGMTGIDYLNLTKKQKKLLDSVMPEEIIYCADRNYDIVKTLKTYMEKHFGKFKKYTILSIGRSLAACCETFKHMGADVKFLPMSCMREDNYADNITAHGLAAYSKYLTSIGLSKERIKANPTHQYIIMDYTYFGRSLNHAHELLTREELLSDLPNIKTLGTDEFLDDIQKGELRVSQFKPYSPISKLWPDQLENVFYAADPFKYDYMCCESDKVATKLFRFRMFELLDADKELKSLV